MEDGRSDIEEWNGGERENVEGDEERRVEMSDGGINPKEGQSTDIAT